MARTADTVKDLTSLVDNVINCMETMDIESEDEKSAVRDKLKAGRQMIAEYWMARYDQKVAKGPKEDSLNSGAKDVSSATEHHQLIMERDIDSLSMKMSQLSSALKQSEVKVESMEECLERKKAEHAKLDRDTTRNSITRDQRMGHSLIDNNQSESPREPFNPANVDLQEASKCGNTSELKKALDRGADIESKVERFGQTSLHVATSYNRKDAVSLLLSMGSNPNTVDDNGKTPLHCAAASGFLVPLCDLLRHGAEVDKTDDYGNTPLILACWSRKLHVVRRLLMGGADLKIRNGTGKTALECATECYNEKAVKILQEWAERPKGCGGRRVRVSFVS